MLAVNGLWIQLLIWRILGVHLFHPYSRYENVPKIYEKRKAQSLKVAIALLKSFTKYHRLNSIQISTFTFWLH